jgi:hypothetical protein
VLRRRNKQLELKNEILWRATAYFARDTLPLRGSGAGGHSISTPPAMQS